MSAVNYKTDDIAAAVKSLPRGVNVYWETVREPDFDKIVSYLGERGRIILMAGRDARPQFPVGPFYVKGCSLHGFVMFKATADEQRACAEDINRWLQRREAQSQYQPRAAAGRGCHGSQAARREHAAKSRHFGGKIVLKP